MKILVVCQYYSPEPVRIADICEGLVSSGHEVDVITGIPNYPMGIIYDGYRHRKKRTEKINGVNVHRCFTVGRRSGILFRFLNYYSFALSSSVYAAGIKKDYDAVFVNQLSPVMMANGAIRYKKKHNKKLLLYCLDLWPESLTAGGIGRSSVIFKLFRRISEKVYSQADKILVTSESFKKYFADEFGMEPHSIGYLPQYAENLFTPEACKKEPDGNTDLLFAGNIGSAQSVETIIRAASLTKGIKTIRFHIVGDGSELEGCKTLAKELGADNVVFYGRKPVEEMPGFYAMADAMIVTLKSNPVISMTLPGKVQSYMAAGKPIIGAIDGEAAKVIADAACGLVSPAEDAKLLAENILKFAWQTDKIPVYSDNSFRYCNQYFSKEGFLNSLADELSDLTTL